MKYTKHIIYGISFVAITDIVFDAILMPFNAATMTHLLMDFALVGLFALVALTVYRYAKDHR